MFQPPTEFRPHWNYFLALESDLESISRYIEFCSDNLNTYSIALAHLLLAASSEVDAVAKCICKIIDPAANPDNIDKYRHIIKTAEQEQLTDLAVVIPRYNLEFIPWKMWADDKSPDWWVSYNKVKHERNVYFNRATLNNALHAVSALLVMNYLYCRWEVVKTRPQWGHVARREKVTCYMKPESTFFRLGTEFYENPIAELSEKLEQLSTQVSHHEGWFKYSR
jgi:hypothetical protein